MDNRRPGTRICVSGRTLALGLLLIACGACATTTTGRPAAGTSSPLPSTPTATAAPTQAATATKPIPPTAAASPAPRLPEAQRGLDMKYVRDSREYETLTRQIYRMATEAVRGAASQVPAGQAWAAVLDVDETALDNSIYQLDRAAYGLPFENSSWNAWVRRGAAGLVPGVTGFVNAVRAAGGRIAWITNRDEEVRDATRENLLRYDLWRDDDRLCLATPDRAYNKAVRRKEIQSGAGACAWPGTPVTVIVFVGDQMGDFPLDAAAHPDEADAKFGKQFFLLPNPMYGTWSSQVTRQ